MLGQDSLINLINGWNTIPSSLLIIGDKGSGKHLVSSYISSKYNIPITDLTSEISLDKIMEIYTSSFTNIYLINIDLITEKEQNMILKLVEEPNIYSKIILLSESKSHVLNTILNRCVLLTMNIYSKNILKSFIPLECKDKEDYILSLCTTPGQIKSILYAVDIIPTMNELCNTIIDKIDKANYYNAINISSKLNYSDKYDKIDCMLFVKNLQLKLQDKILNDTNKKYYNYYKIVNKYYNIMSDSRLDRKKLIELMLDEIIGNSHE